MTASDVPPADWVEEVMTLTLEELSHSTRCSTEWLVALVREGALDPQGDAPEQWQFAGAALRRARVAGRLQRDLEINAAGAALVLDLLDEIAALRRQLGIAGPRR